MYSGNGYGVAIEMNVPNSKEGKREKCVRSAQDINVRVPFLCVQVYAYVHVSVYTRYLSKGTHTRILHEKTSERSYIVLVGPSNKW